MSTCNYSINRHQHIRQLQTGLGQSITNRCEPPDFTSHSLHQFPEVTDSLGGVTHWTCLGRRAYTEQIHISCHQKSTDHTSDCITVENLLLCLLGNRRLECNTLSGTRLKYCSIVVRIGWESQATIQHSSRHSHRTTQLQDYTAWPCSTALIDFIHFPIHPRGTNTFGTKEFIHTIGKQTTNTNGIAMH